MPTPRRSKYIDQAVIAALRDVAILEAAINAYEFAATVAKNRALGGLPVNYKPDDTLRIALWMKRSEAQSRALTFGSLSTNEELQRKAWEVAADYIVRSNTQIMGYLEVTNVSPDSYLANVRDDFRGEIRDAVREKLGLEPGERAFWDKYVPEELTDTDDADAEEDDE